MDKRLAYFFSNAVQLRTLMRRISAGCSASFIDLVVMAAIRQVKVLDRVLGDLYTLRPSQVDAVAIVNTTIDPGQAKECYEIIEVTGGYGEAAWA